MANRKGRKASFGNLRRLPSRRWQARYTGPDGLTHTAPVTFDTKTRAEAYLATVRADLVRDVWQPSGKAAPMTFEDYAVSWLGDRTLKPRTRAHYTMLLDRLILPTFGAFTLKAITSDAVRRWHAELGTSRPTLRAHGFALLRSILGSAVADQLIPVNPAHIRGGSSSKRVHEIRPATLGELEALVTAMRPERYRLLVLMAAWCGLRQGELCELRRGDIDVKNGVIRVRRAVVHVGGQAIVDSPKSAAGVRDVAIPPHLMGLVKEHLRDNITGGKDGLLWPASDGVSHLPPSTLYTAYWRARQAAGRPDLRFHDLRHTQAVMAAQTGATLAELMNRLGHSTPAMALRYQHLVSGRDAEIAKALSAMAETALR
jgi:integrase